MTHWIDRAAIWGFAASSAFLMMLSLTNGHIAFSACLTGGIILFMRLLIGRLPEKRWYLRRERLRYIQNLLTRCAVMPHDEAKNTLRGLVPSLLSESEWTRALIVQRLPGSLLTADQLLALRRERAADEEAIFICICPAADEARALLTSLPPCRLIEGNRLVRALLKAIRSVPVGETKKERRQLACSRIAPYIRSIRPLRTGLYALLFTALYLMSRRLPYLLAAVSLTVFLLLKLLIRIRSTRAG